MAMIKCRECGKDVSNQADACPHCGCPVKKADAIIEAAEKKKTENLCLIGMIVAIVSWFLDLLGLVGITALILSVLGLKEAKGKYKTFAIIGIVFASIEIVLKTIQLLSLLN